MKRVGVYQVGELLGQGGMGQVYRGYDERLDRWVALKQVRSAADSPERRQRLRREARVLARLSHASIVPIFDLVEADDGDWVVLELVDGPGLDQLLSQGPLDHALVVRVGLQIAEGLTAAHAKGILHRDLKAENVKLSESGQARILDFGLAKDIAGQVQEPTLSVSGQLLGTIRAMSPEQVRGLELDERSDLFALGVLLYEMATGVSPFQANNPADTLVKICTDQQDSAISRVPSLSVELSDLIDELLEKAPEMRPRTAAEVADRLRRMASHLPDPEAARSQETRTRSIAAVAAEETLIAQPAPIVSAAEPGTRGSSYSSFSWPNKARSPALLGISVMAVLALWVGLSNGPWDSGPWPAGARHEGAALTSAAGSAASHDDSSDPYALHQRGWALLDRFDKKGNVDQAITTFQRLIELDADSAVGHAGLARAYWRKFHNDGKDPQLLERSRVLAERAVELDAYLAKAQLSLGYVQVSAGQLEDALDSFDRARDLDPVNGEAWLGIGIVRRKQGDESAAEQAFSKGISVDPTPELLDSLGQLHYSKGRYKEAETAFRSSIEEAPDRIFGYRNLAAALHAQGDIGGAAGQLQSALAIRPEPTLYANLGTLYYFQGLFSRAAEAFNQALKLGGGAHNYLLWANLGDAYRQLPDRETEAREAYDVAIRLAQQELDRQPEDAELESRLMLFEARRGPTPESRERLKHSASTWLATVEDPWVAHRLALAHELSGDRDKALRWLETALRRGQSLREVETEPDFLELRSDPRYQRLLAKLEAEAL